MKTQTTKCITLASVASLLSYALIASEASYSSSDSYSNSNVDGCSGSCSTQSCTQVFCNAGSNGNCVESKNCDPMQSGTCSFQGNDPVTGAAVYDCTAS